MVDADETYFLCVWGATAEDDTSIIIYGLSAVRSWLAQRLAEVGYKPSTRVAADCEEAIYGFHHSSPIHISRIEDDFGFSVIRITDLGPEAAMQLLTMFSSGRRD